MEYLLGIFTGQTPKGNIEPLLIAFDSFSVLRKAAFDLCNSFGLALCYCSLFINSFIGCQVVTII